MKIDLGTFKDNGEELVAFLEPRVGTKPTVDGEALEIDDGSLRKGVRPRHVKTYLKRFLFMKGVRKKYRVLVAGAELSIVELEVPEEKEKEEEKAAGVAKEEQTKEAPKEEQKEEKPKEKAEKPKAPKKAKPKKKKTEQDSSS